MRVSVYLIDIFNWNDPSFWSGLSEVGSGHTLDFSTLGTQFTVDVDPDAKTISLSDGSTSFTIGEPGALGVDATFGGTTLLEFFTLLWGSAGSDTLSGTDDADTVDGDQGNDLLTGGAGDDSLVGGDGNDTLIGDYGLGEPVFPGLFDLVEQTGASNPFDGLDAGTWSAPSFVDIDNDGDLDLVSGNDAGRFMYSENTGTVTNPVYGAFVENPFGLSDLGDTSTPEFADLDGDGDLDMLAGSFSGNFAYYENVGTASSPSFAARVTNPFGLSDIGAESNVELVDIDGDGDLDLFSGEVDGNFNFFENTGTSTAPAFSGPVVDPFGLSALASFSSLEMIDADGDGDFDAFLADQAGNLYYSENIGDSTTPLFDAYVPDPFGYIDTIGTMPTLADIDGDGDADLIYGRTDGTLAYWQNETNLVGASYNDTLEGGKGNDSIIAGQGDDLVFGGEGQDTIIAGAGDTISGGTGGDTIILDAAYVDAAGGNTSATTVDGGSGGYDSDTLDLTGYAAYANLSQTLDGDGNSVSGSVDVIDANGDTFTLTFTEIETLLLPAPYAPGTVSGGDGNDLIDGTYSGDPDGDQIDNADAIFGGHAPDDDLVLAGSGDDTVIAGDGADTIYGGFGNDILYGDRASTGGGFPAPDGATHEILAYTVDATDYDGKSDTFKIDIKSVSVSDDGSGAQDVTVSLDPAIDFNELRITGNGPSGGDGDPDIIRFDLATYQDDFSVSIQNEDSVDTLVFQNSESAFQDAVTGVWTINYFGADAALHTITVDAGQAEVTIDDGAVDPATSGDGLYGEEGDDSLNGGVGHDTLDGGTGNDTITGGAGDAIQGGEGADTIVLNAMHLDATGANLATATVDGGAGGDDSDTLDLSGYAGYTNLTQTPDGDGNSSSGSVDVTDANGDTFTVTFTDIENLILPPLFTPGVVGGSGGNDLIDASYTGDPDGDIIDGADAILVGHAPDDDFVVAGDGDDTVLAGDGADTVLGGGGNDHIFGDNEPLGTPFAAPDGATHEVLSYFVDATDFDGKADRHNVDVDAISANTALAQDIDLSLDPAEDVTTLSIVNGGGADGQQDIYRLDLSTFQDDFTLTIQDEDALDAIVFSNIDTATQDTISGNWTITYTGSDALTHTITVNPDLATVYIDDPGDASLLADSLEGGDGNDTLEAGYGLDTLVGGAGDDLLLAGSGDSILGGDGSDTIVLDPQWTDDSDRNLSATSVDGGSGGTDNDTLDLSAYFGYQNLAQTPDGDGNSTSGSVDVFDANGDSFTVNFTEIETLILPAPFASGTVSGSDADDLIDAAYLGDPDGDRIDNADAIIGGHAPEDDLVIAGDGNDTVVAGDGADSVEGGTGNDLIYGDTSTGRDAATSFAAPDPGTHDVLAYFVDATDYDGKGEFYSVDVKSISTDPDGAGAEDVMVSLDGALDINELRIKGNGGIDGDGEADIFRFDLATYQDDFSLTIQSEDVIDTLVFSNVDEAVQDEITGIWTLTYTGADALQHTISVDGGLAKVVVEGGGALSTDPSLLADTLLGQDGDDTLFGGAGNDVLDGGTGADMLVAGAGDTVTGGDDADYIAVDEKAIDANGLETASISVDGGSGGTDDDVLDLTEYVSFANLTQTPDGDGNSTSGSVDVTDADGNTTTIAFTEIEHLLLPFDGDGVVQGSYFGERIDTSYTGDPDGDLVDASDAVLAGHAPDDDSILAGAGDDTVVASDGADTIEGGWGDDTLYGDYAQYSEIGSAFQAQNPATHETLSYFVDASDFDSKADAHVIDVKTVSSNSSGDGSQDVVVTMDPALDATTLTIKGNGGADGDNVEDIFRFDLSTFSDDFTLTIQSEDPIDKIVLSNTDTAVQDPVTGVWTITYTGSDALSHTITVDADLAEVIIDTPIDPATMSDSIVGGHGSDVIDAGFGDDTVEGGVGNDTVYVSQGSDFIDGGDGVDTYDARGIGTSETYNAFGEPNSDTHEVLTYVVDASDAEGGAHEVQVSAISSSANDPAPTDVAIQLDPTIDINTLLIKGIGGAGGDGEADNFRFDLATYQDDFQIAIQSEDAIDTLVFTNATSYSETGGIWTITYTGLDGGEHSVTVDPGAAQVVIASTSTETTYQTSTTQAEVIDVTVDTAGDGTVVKTVDGNTDTVTSVESFVAGEVEGETDSFTLTGSILASEVKGISDDAKGFMVTIGGDTIAFGNPGEPLISTILSGSYVDPILGAVSAAGDYTILSGDESGTLGGISLANFETIKFSVVDPADGYVDGTAGDDIIDATYVDPELEVIDGGDAILAGHAPDDDVVLAGAGNDSVVAGLGDDTVLGGAGNDTILGGVGADALAGEDGDDTLLGGTGNDILTGGDGNDVFGYAAGDGNDTITDFNTGNTGTLSDGDSTNNDFIDLSAFYDNIWELHADQADDGILNQSNQGVGGVDYSDNTSMAGGSLTFTGATADASYFTQENTGVICFAKGTLIRTPSGDMPVQNLRRGSVVDTLDKGPQEVVWIAETTFSRDEIEANARLRPVRISEKLTGGSQPLVVSRQHCLLAAGPQGQQVWVRAIQLANLRGGLVRVIKAKRAVTYYHVLLKSHCVLFANGVATESFYPGEIAVASLSTENRATLGRALRSLGAIGPERAYGGRALPVASRWDLPDHQSGIDLLTSRSALCLKVA